MNRKNAIICQARLGSTRLKNKLTRPFFQDLNLFEFILQRLNKANLGVPIIVALPDSSENDSLEEMAITRNVSVFRGSEQNVLQRFIQAAQKFEVEGIIRVCLDNPFLSIHNLKLLISATEYTASDYTSFRTSDGTPSIKSHFGFWAEYVSRQSLEKTEEETNENLFLEHVTNFIYTHPDSFSLEWLPISPRVEKANWARFTVDTETDFTHTQSIVQTFGIDGIPEPDELIEYVQSQNEVRESMQREILKNSK